MLQCSGHDRTAAATQAEQQRHTVQKRRSAVHTASNRAQALPLNELSTAKSCNTGACYACMAISVSNTYDGRAPA